MTGPAGGRPLPLLVVVDGANVVGSVPDGWWRDRRGAAERLRDALVPVAAAGLPPREGVPDWAVGGPVEVVLVVEGAARGVPSVPGVAVESAPGSGDDLVAELAARVAASAPGRRCLVVTADRGLRARVEGQGAAVTGPRSVRRT
ncbi:NTP pyrophosphohydrolase [Actinacidiphila yeochonensis]|uniref:NTP pyrophosphohydrolase n=1 Tax=Actinacidiphila yeochonensis TaxID=89050 RepID=UPI00068ADFB5|nr:NTP pyrophosphohydrolase [Actinacidiphila yeochonensis]